MRAALLIALLPILLGVCPAGAENRIALWHIDDVFLGMMENGEVYRHDPATGQTQLAGSFGEGPWVSFGRRDDQLLALEPDGEVWAMLASSGEATPHWWAHSSCRPLLSKAPGDVSNRPTLGVPHPGRRSRSSDGSGRVESWRACPEGDFGSSCLRTGFDLASFPA